MASLSETISKLFIPIPTRDLGFRPHHRRFTSLPSHFKVQAVSSPSSSKDNHVPNLKKNTKKPPRAPRRLITISTSSGRFHGQWSCDYVLSLRELQLADLAEDGQKDAEVFVSLSVQKHSGFGFSVDGRIITSISRKCSCCLSSYCTEIDTTFDVWVLPSSKSSETQLPEIGGSDPSVVYVQPGSEADLDSLVQDTIRLTASGKDTCSEACEKSAVIWQYTDSKRSYDKRWSRLLEIKNAM
ncbi:uncharacterized protein LOC109837418 isoform X2 [Asparagus officinalis]|uniref:uncharacterized protein LOC109837418 isoform X2 n=1 Tax=Asparagus officinalis TaxID=4686 RepID=UPI00098E3D88|nr:uncharacterized protein LOC109837418 isoform X2 [Asparagus officinalis]